MYVVDANLALLRLSCKLEKQGLWCKDIILFKNVLVLVVIIVYGWFSQIESGKWVLDALSKADRPFA